MLQLPPNSITFPGTLFFGETGEIVRFLLFSEIEFHFFRISPPKTGGETGETGKPYPPLRLRCYATESIKLLLSTPSTLDENL